MKFWQDWKLSRGSRSWAQCGEDLIADFYFKAHRAQVSSYLDIGAHHPFHLSNTYLFHRQGRQGVLVEASSEACKALRSGRPGDHVVWAAVVPKARQSVVLQKMSSSSLNTVSLADADSTVAHSRYGKQARVGSEEVPALTVNQVLEQHCRVCPDLVSLDIEGLDLPVLRSWDFRRWRPRFFVVETLRFRPSNGKMERIRGIDQVFRKAGYKVYADTFINTLYCNEDPLLSLSRR